MFFHLASEIAEGELGPFDRNVAGWIQAQRGQYDRLMYGLTWLGSFVPLAVINGSVALMLSARKKLREAAYVLLCGGGAVLLCSALKLLFQRARPRDVFMIAAPHSYSFPSGHAMGSVGVVGAIVILLVVLTRSLTIRLSAALAGLVTVLGIAISRVYFGVHYPSDVIGGQLAGAAWVAAVTGWFYPRLLPAEASASK